MGREYHYIYSEQGVGLRLFGHHAWWEGAKITSPRLAARRVRDLARAGKR